MNKYRIRYKTEYKGVNYVYADSVNGFQPTSDTFTFKIDGQVVAAIPKDVVTSVIMIDIEHNQE